MFFTVLRREYRMFGRTNPLRGRAENLSQLSRWQSGLPRNAIFGLHRSRSICWINSLPCEELSMTLRGDEEMNGGKLWAKRVL
jgi:hypothetical protein